MTKDKLTLVGEDLRQFDMKDIFENQVLKDNKNAIDIPLSNTPLKKLSESSKEDTNTIADC